MIHYSYCGGFNFYALSLYRKQHKASIPGTQAAH